MSACRGIKYISLHGVLGYFSAAKQYMLGFNRRHIPVSWRPLVPDKKWPGGFGPFQGRELGEKELDRFCNRDIDYDTVILHISPDLYPYWISKESGKRILGYTVWETDRLPDGWPELLNQIPRILVPSSWNKQVFQNSGVTADVGVVPHLFRPEKAVDNNLIADILDHDFVFYAVEEWRARKGLEKTIQCYLRTFQADDPTLLLIKTSSNIYYQSALTKLKRLKKIYRIMRRTFKISENISIRPSAEQIVSSLQKTYKNPGRIKIITSRINDAEVAGIHKRGNCYISLCSSEGWGLGPFTAAGYGNPVIMTGYGGQLDYLPEPEAYLVDYQKIPARDDENPELFTDQQYWGNPDMEHAVRLMRQVFENREEAAGRGKKLKEYIRTRFNEEKVIDLFLKQIGQTKKAND